MKLELDHLFICSRYEAPEADLLVEFGLVEGSPNTHPGQGTANRRFFFHNMMLELLWLSDQDEALSEMVRPTALYERTLYLTSGASPFGFCFRPAEEGPFSFPAHCWDYRPPYMPPGTSLHIAGSSNEFHEPFLVYVPHRWRPDQFPPERRQPIDHPAGLRELTEVRLTHRGSASYSVPLTEAVENCDRFKITSGAENLIELGFDSELQNRRADFRPELPLVISW